MPTGQYDFQNENKMQKRTTAEKALWSVKGKECTYFLYNLISNLKKQNLDIKVLFFVFSFLWPHKSEMFILNEKIAPEISY